VTSMGKDMPGRFRLQREGLCAAVMGSSSNFGFDFVFMHCSVENSLQIFTTKLVDGGFQITSGETGQCLDAGGGRTVLIYPCYESSVKNVNQLWEIDDGQLVWPGTQKASGFCVDVVKQERETEKRGGLWMEMCADKEGQRIRKYGELSDGTFLLRDGDSGKCVGRLVTGDLDLVECGKSQLWRTTTNGLAHVDSKDCLWSSYNGKAGIKKCHVPGRQQRFSLVGTPGVAQQHTGYADNGRQRFHEQCLDYLPATRINVVLQDCAGAQTHGVRWTAIGMRVPLERTVWDAQKPCSEQPKLG